MERVDRVFHQIELRLAQFGTGGLILFAMFYVTLNVFFRYALRLGGIPGMREYVSCMLVPITFFALAYNWFKRGGFIRVNIVQDRLHGTPIREKLHWGSQFLFTLMALLAFAVPLAIGAYADFRICYTTGRLAGNPGYFSPIWPWKIPMILGASLLAIRLIIDLINMVRTGKVWDPAR